MLATGNVTAQGSPLCTQRCLSSWTFPAALKRSLGVHKALQTHVRGQGCCFQILRQRHPRQDVGNRVHALLAEVTLTVPPHSPLAVSVRSESMSGVHRLPSDPQLSTHDPAPGAAEPWRRFMLEAVDLGYPSQAIAIWDGCGERLPPVLVKPRASTRGRGLFPA